MSEIRPPDHDDAAALALGATLARIAALDIEHLAIDARLGAQGGPGWRTRDELLVPAALDEAMAVVGRHAHTELAAVRATWLLEGYAFALSLPAIVALLCEGRVPDLAADNVALHHDGAGGLDAVAFVSPRFWALPGDDEARAAGAPLAPSPDALADRLREGLTSHLTPLVEALRPRAGRGARALWASVEDTVSGTLLWIGRSLGDAGAARAWADRLLGVAPPLSGRAVFLEVAHAGGSETMLRRNGCCLTYRRESGDGVPCITCPRTSPQERRRRLEAAGEAPLRQFTAG